MAPPRKKPLPPGAKPSPRKASVSSAGGVAKHHSTSTSTHRTTSKSSAAAAAAATALAAGSSAPHATGRSKPRAKPQHRPNVEQPPLPSFERMDNGMRFSSIPVVLNINQKNYYTDYLKKDDQIYTNRLISSEAKDAEAREAAAKLAPQETDSPDSDEEPPDQGGSKVIVIHPGSRNLRIGLASETFPHTVPMVIARPSAATFSALPPTPLRVRDDPESSDPLFGQAFEDGVGKLDAILKARLKVAKKRTVPNARELVASYNRRSQYEEVLDINDVEQIEWIDLGPDQKFCTGKDVLPTAVRTKDRHYELRRIQSWDDTIGHYRMELLGDIQLILEQAIKSEMGISATEFSNYGAVLVIPDLFEKNYVNEMTRLLFQDMGFAKVAYLQESVSATFGAGLSHACVLDVGAQTTTIACVDEGAIIPDSRINLKYGGDDITDFFTRLLLRSAYPWPDVDLHKSVDFRVLQYAKERSCTLFENEVAMQLGESVIRNKGEKTKKFSWRVYDEVYLAPLAMFLPQTMGKGEKMPTRHTIISRSTDLYDGSFNDQESGAQNAMANQYAIPIIQPVDSTNIDATKPTNGATEIPTPSRRPSPSIQSVAGDVPESVVDASRRSASPAAVASPAPVAANGSLSTPQTEKINRAPTPTQGQSSYFPPTNQSYDDELTVANIPSLEYAVATSIRFASLPALSSMTTTNLGEDRSRRLYSSILVVGSGALTAGLGYVLEDRVRSLRGGTVSVIPPPRDIDPGVLVWKGASVYARLKTAEREAFMTRREWDLLNVRGVPLRTGFVF